MNGQSNNKFRDILHVSVLLVCAPAVFYGGYLLMANSVKNKDDLKLLPVQEKIAEAKQGVSNFLNGDQPRNGDEWVSEIESLKSKLEAVAVTAQSKIAAKDHLDDQLATLREHCEKHKDEVPAEVSVGSPLGDLVKHIGQQIIHLESVDSAMPTLVNWESEFQQAENERHAQLRQSIDSYARQGKAPLIESYQLQLNKLTRQNSQLADELQRHLNQTETVQRSTQEAVAKQKRKQAFLMDKDEIEQLLKPFITPAHFQLGSSLTDWRKTAEPEPISYRQLEAVGALSNDIKGIENLATIGSPHPNSKRASSRPRGSFPVYHVDFFSSTEIQKVKRAQHLIRKHSIYLIESGYLHP